MGLGRILVLSSVRVRVNSLIQIAQGVVHLAMFGLVCPHVHQQILDRALILRHLPVLNSNLRCLLIGPVRKLSVLDVIDGTRISDHCLFFKVADESMADAGRNEVGYKEAVEEDTLGAQNHEAHEETGLGEFKEGE